MATKVPIAGFAYSCKPNPASTAGLSTSFTCKSTLTTSLYNTSIRLSSGSSSMACYAIKITDLYAATSSYKDSNYKKFSSVGGYVFTSNSSVDLYLYASAPT